MPWHRDFAHLKAVTISLWFMAIITMVGMFTVFKHNQTKTYNKLTTVESEMKINTEATRKVLEVTQKEIDDIKEKMNLANQKLEQAQQKLLPGITNGQE